VHRLNPGARFQQAAADIDETARLADHHDLGAARENVFHLCLHHRLGDLGVNHAEDPAETAADLGFFERDQLQTPDRPEQLQRLAADPQPARQVAGIMAGDAVGERDPDIRNLKDVDEKLAEFQDAPREPKRPFPLRRSIGEHPGITVFDELDAGTGRGHDVALGVGKGVHPAEGHLPPLGLEAAVVEGLPAAGLVLRKFAADAEALQQEDHLLQDIGKKIFPHAGDEQLYRLHGWLLSQVSKRNQI